MVKRITYNKNRIRFLCEISNSSVLNDYRPESYCYGIWWICAEKGGKVVHCVNGQIGLCVNFNGL